MKSRTKLQFRREIGGACAQIARISSGCASRVNAVLEEEKGKLENLPENLSSSSLSDGLEQDISDMEELLEEFGTIGESLDSLKEKLGYEDTEVATTPMIADSPRPEGYENPGRKKRDVRMIMLVTEDVRGNLKRFSNELGVSINEIVNVALSRELSRLDRR